MSRRGVLLTALWPLPVFCVLGLALFGWERARAPLPVFLDTTAKAGITFQLLSSRTPQKYLIESMPGGVAMLDYDGDGFEDLFFVNGARLQNPMPLTDSRTSSSSMARTCKIPCLPARRPTSPTRNIGIGCIATMAMAVSST